MKDCHFVKDLYPFYYYVKPIGKNKVSVGNLVKVYHAFKYRIDQEWIKGNLEKTAVKLKEMEDTRYYGKGDAGKPRIVKFDHGSVVHMDQTKYHEVKLTLNGLLVPSEHPGTESYKVCYFWNMLAFYIG